MDTWDDDRPVQVGDTLHGFCGGHFGRDSYGTKRVEAIGADWCVAREIDTGAVVFTASGNVAMELRTFRWPAHHPHLVAPRPHGPAGTGRPAAPQRGRRGGAHRRGRRADVGRGVGSAAAGPRRPVEGETMTIDVGLPKWPRLLVKGEDVTEEQANEILIRTNGWWCFSTNDKRFERDVWRLANVEVDEKFGWPKDGETEQLSHELSALDLEYLHNNRIASAWIGGSHGWCDWNGTIGCSSHNIGKWPSADEVDAEWRTIAAAFPYLRLDAQLVDDEGEGNVLISWRIEDGDVVLNPMPNPRDFLRPVHEPDISGLLMSHVMGRGSREQGVSLDRLEVALAQVRA